MMFKIIVKFQNLVKGEISFGQNIGALQVELEHFKSVQMKNFYILQQHLTQEDS